MLISHFKTFHEDSLLDPLLLSYPNNPDGGVVLNGDRPDVFGVLDEAGPELPPGDRIEFVLYLNNPDIFGLLPPFLTQHLIIVINHNNSDIPLN